VAAGRLFPTGGWGICTSMNSGATWTQCSAPHYAWTSLAPQQV
jgi:hypothetical protein